MANIASFPLSFTVIGDGVSLTAAVAVAPTPTAVTLGQVQDVHGKDVSSNVVSAILVGSTVTLTFVTAFSGAISVSISLAYPSLGNNTVGQNHAQIAGVNVVTAAAGVLKVGTVGNAGAIFDGATAVAVPANAIQVGASDGTLLQPFSINVKGTQGARGLAVQELKDAGRTALSFFVDNIAGVAADALATMSITKGAVAQTAATSYTVTAGKTLRLTSITYTVRSSTNAQQISQLRIRTAASGITVASPIIFNFMGEAPAASTYTQSMAFPDGYEIAGGTQIAMSHIEIVTPASTEITVCLVGFEY
jgi:hypothetical protein